MGNHKLHHLDNKNIKASKFNSNNTIINVLYNHTRITLYYIHVSVQAAVLMGKYI